MGRWLGALFTAGGAGGLCIVALPHWSQLNASVCLATSITAVVVGLGLLRYGPHLPVSSFPWLAGMGTLVVSAAVYGAGPAGSTTAGFFALVGLYVGAMFSTVVVVVELALIGVAYAACLATVHTTGAPARWFTAMVITAIVAGITAGITRANRHAALHDPLTGLPNRRALNEALAIFIAAAGRRTFPLSAAIIDLDQFKQLNADLGHQGADDHLVDTVACWRRLLRPEDIMARYGGDEFVLLLPDTDMLTAMTIMGRLRSGSPAGGSFSAGVATWDCHETADALLRRADAALFRAKAQGRDRVIGADPTSRP